MIPYLNMSCRVTIGPVRFHNVHSINIEESIVDLGNTAKIVLPRNFRELNGKKVLDYIKAGDPVEIWFGYNGNLVREFKGYVRQIEAEIPLVVHCDDEFWPLKQNNWVKSYRAVTLKSLLQEIAPGYTINSPETNLGKYMIDNKSTFQELKKIQGNYGLYTRIIDGTLHMQFAYEWQAGINRHWIYDRQVNVRASDLKWQRVEDVKVKVRVEYIDKDGKKQYVETGSKDDKVFLKNKKLGVGATKADAEKYAKAEYKLYQYDGFTGSITGFGTPSTHAGDSLEIRNKRYPEQNGSYLIEKVSKEYAPAHISVQNHIGRKLV